MHRSEAPSRSQRSMRRAGRRVASLLLIGCALGAFAAAPQTVPQPRATLDQNGDGVLDEPELRAAAEATFKTADANGDGYLTAEEARAARMAGDVERTTRGLGGLLGARGRNAAAERFERLDADGDGRIAENEFVSAPHPLLRFDADGDRRVTREEIEQARKAMRPGLL